MSTAISFHQVSRVFGDFTALDSVTFDVPTGSIFGVVGTSGAGKSTLIRTVNGLETPSSGSVTVLGTPLDEADLRALRRTVSMVFQHYNLLSSKTVAENVAIPLVLSKTPKSEIDERVAEVLGLVGLAERTEHRPGQLSGGQQQRVAIARALITNPDLLLCDEPILIITHQMNVIAAIADHVAVLEHGHLIEHGPVEQVFAHPREALTRQFVGTVVPQRLPDTLVQEVSSGTWDTVLRVVHTDAAGRGVISHLEKEFGIQVELLHAVDASLRHTSVGIIILGLRGPSIVIDQALQWLHSRKHLEVEILP